MLSARHTPNHGIIQMLIKAGADVLAKDNNGNTAYDFAQNDAIKETLIKAVM